MKIVTKENLIKLEKFEKKYALPKPKINKDVKPKSNR